MLFLVLDINLLVLCSQIKRRPIKESVRTKGDKGRDSKKFEDRRTLNIIGCV